MTGQAAFGSCPMLIIFSDSSFVTVPKLKKYTAADLSAVLSDHVVLRKFRNQLVISKVTVPRKSKSVKKQASINRFRAANSWAKNILQQPGMKELYSKGINSKLSNAHTVAVSDYLNPPEIHYIDLKGYTGAAGDEIRIKVTDVFRVVAVTVTIAGSNGKQLEAGSAVRYVRKPAIWIYTLTRDNPHVKGTVIQVKASDLPENTVEFKFDIE